MEGTMYDKLDEKKEEIRLLILQPAANLYDDIVTHLQKVSLLDAPVYEAISYCWGDATKTRDICLQDQNTTITVSLFGALRRLRHPDKPRTLWADAICINQKDIPERNAQVRLMAKVYSRAAMVEVWLGEEDDFTETAFSILEELAQGTTIKELQATEPVRYLTPTTILSIFKRPWFKRLWVMQEVVLAPDAEIICGGHRLSFDIIKVLAALHTEGSGMGNTHEMFRDRINLDIAVAIKDHFLNYLQKLNGIEKHKNDFQTAAIMFGRCRQLQCREPHDKIYGLLGLLRMENDIQVDYDRPVLDVYRDAAMVYLLQCESPCILLDSARDDFSRPTVDWPSWVPDWRLNYKSKPGRSAGWSDTLSYNATLDVMDIAPKVLGQSVLSVKALHASIIRVVGETMDPYQKTAECQAQRASYESLIGSDSCLPAAIRVIEQLQSWQATLEVNEFDFWRIVFRDRIGSSEHGARSQNPRMGGWRRMSDEICGPYANAWREILHSQSKAIADESVLSRYANSFQGLEPYLVDARPFRTTWGLAGQGPCNIEAGDHIAIIAGIPSPMVLRPVPERGTKFFQNVGPCYVHGIMHGEAVANRVRKRGGGCRPEDVFGEIYIV
ncbi:MAG: hypothetical protein Q9219_003557 [cf. Caloplaca sp. 3 TL-2023]